MLLTVLDLAGIAVFAVSGSLAAVRARMDVVGVVTLSVLTALGGGIIRDLVLGITPPTSLTRPAYLLTPVGVALLILVWHPTANRLQRSIQVADAIGLGLFATAGATTALAAKAPPSTAVITGLITAVGGGVLRDVLANDVPTVLRRNTLYAVPALAGALLVTAGHELGTPPGPTAAVAAGTVTLTRLAAVRLGWEAPLPRHRDGQPRSS